MYMLYTLWGTPGEHPGINRSTASIHVSVTLFVRLSTYLWRYTKWAGLQVSKVRFAASAIQ